MLKTKGKEKMFSAAREKKVTLHIGEQQFK